MVSETAKYYQKQGIISADNLAKLWDHLRNVYASTDRADQGQAIIDKVKQLFDDFVEFLPLVRSTQMLSPVDKARALALCKKLPKDLHVLCPDRSAQVKTWMIFFEMHDFIEMWGSIGQFTEEVFETRHAKRNELNRRFACIRST